MFGIPKEKVIEKIYANENDCIKYLEALLL
jgi:hypothetical protein